MFTLFGLPVAVISFRSELRSARVHGRGQGRRRTERSLRVEDGTIEALRHDLSAYADFCEDFQEDGMIFATVNNMGFFDAAL